MIIGIVFAILFTIVCATVIGVPFLHFLREDKTKPPS